MGNLPGKMGQNWRNRENAGNPQEEQMMLPWLA